MPSVEAEINLGAGPAEPADSSSSPEFLNDGDYKYDVALAYALLGVLTSVLAYIATHTS